VAISISNNIRTDVEHLGVSVSKKVVRNITYVFHITATLFSSQPQGEQSISWSAERLLM